MRDTIDVFCNDIAARREVNNMVRLEKLDADERRVLENANCPTFQDQPWVKGPPLKERRVAIISTAGLHQRDDRPFTREPGDFYRIIPGDIKADNLIMSHVSVNFDRAGFYQDWNVVFPIDCLRELAGEGAIGSVAGFHYSFMGADDPVRWEQPARYLAGLLKQDNVNAVLLVPV
ncbi:MAG: selenoprotein B glycine/betaine/sarcosine/D-proline reductase [Chloroflexi bacterium]|nr:selenoprotein B glycine/betaine/sarcosine/D-proline reductase [Chloroflexota bacterium]